MDEIELRCSTEAGEVFPIYRGNVSRDTTPPRVKLTATNLKNASDINCAVMSRSTKLSYYSFKFNFREGQLQLLNGECFKLVHKSFQISTYILSVVVVLIMVLLFLAFFMHKSQKDYAKLKKLPPEDNELQFDIRDKRNED